MTPEEVRKQYENVKKDVKARIRSFRDLRDAGEERVFQELVFVILTSQTEAEKAWSAAERLGREDLLIDGSEPEIKKVLESEDIQYPEDKARYIKENRRELNQPTLSDPEKGLKLKEKISDRDPEKAREWLVDNVRGLSWKGASHFMRNTGRGKEFAIISSHIVGKMHQLGLIDDLEMPSGKEEYLEYEKLLEEFSEDIGIPLEELDLVLWSMETGEVFK